MPLHFNDGPNKNGTFETGAEKYRKYEAYKHIHHIKSSGDDKIYINGKRHHVKHRSKPQKSRSKSKKSRKSRSKSKKRK